MQPLAPIELPLTDALNCLVATDIVAKRDVPAFDTCAIDGFAVRSGVLGTLTIIDATPAGFVSECTVDDATAIRVAAGSPLPAGADAVVPWNASTQTLELTQPATAEENVLRSGSELALGEPVCSAGDWVDPRAIARLAASGHHAVLVHPRPRVVVVPIGSELAATAETVRPGIIENATGPMLLAELRLNSMDGFLAEVVADDDEAVREAIEEARLRADFIVTTGGLGVLEGGALARALDTHGGLTAFEETPVFALPGEPAAALQRFRSDVSPLLQRMRGVTAL